MTLHGRRSALLGEIVAAPPEPEPPVNSGNPDVMAARFDSFPLRPFDAGETSADAAEIESWFGQSAAGTTTFRQNNIALIDDDTNTGRGKVMRHRYVPDGTGTPAVESWNTLDTTSDVMTLQYDLYFEPGFDFDTGGGKLPGLTGTYQSGKTWKTLGTFWSARFMFIDLVGSSTAYRPIVYAYHPDQPNTYGHWFNLRNPDSSFMEMPAGVWHTLRQKITMNSAAGTFDGRCEAWLNGVKGLDRTMRWWDGSHAANERTCGGFVYSSFFGGNTAYYDPNTTVFARFDNFEISTDDSLLTGGAYV